MDSFADWIAPGFALEIVTDVGVKATIILGMAWGTTVLLRNTSAAVRHGVWSIALAALLLLPVLTIYLPAWYVELPAVIEGFVFEYSAGEVPAHAPAALEAVAAGAEGATAVASGNMVAQQEEAPHSRAGSKTPEVEVVTVAGSGVPLGIPWSTWFILVWGAGALVLLGHLLLHLVRLWVLARHACAVTDPARVAQVRGLAQRLGIRRQVRVLCSPEISMAMTWGTWRPVVMLPYQAHLWSEDRRRVVLLHELAHVKRYDYLIHLLTQLLRAWYWFNPLVWIAARRVYVEQERACDDQVLQAGAGACDYATHLLDIARSFLKRPAPLPSGVAMVRGSTLRERIEAILNGHSKRQGLTLKSSLAAACMGSLLILPVATIQLYRADLAQGADPVAAVPSALPQKGLLAGDSAVWHKAALSSDLDGEALARLLQHDDATLRGRAAWALGVRKETHAVEPLLTALGDEQAQVRWQVVRALGELEDRRALDALENTLHDSCPDVRSASVRAVEKICRCHALDVLPGVLTDPNVQVRMTAAQVLGETIRELKADDGYGAKRALRDHLRPAVRALLGALNDESSVVRQRVAYALGEARDEAAVDALEDMLHDKAASVRLEAVRALGKIAVPCSAPALRRMLRDQDPDVRAVAGSVLTQLNAS